ncbi:hypothetical protein OG426_46675 [Streptomyces canus]|uniref:hypothetical protein n=1 Tax=Streptomyces canus TaxID=58343 RepID=UPI0038694316|nr:hypothetical protein OG426_46675 [Streptomyces canus]
MFLPRFDVVRQVLDSGMLGEVWSVLADLGEYFDPAGGHRIRRGTWCSARPEGALH